MNIEQSRNLSGLLALCESAPPDLLMMSRKDCHASKVSSIVFGRNDRGGLDRAFLAWDGHKLRRNTLYDTLPVGIHNHRYSLRLRLVCGNVTNTTYERQDHGGRELHEFEFRSGQMSGESEIRRVGNARIGAFDSCWLVRDCWLEIAADVFHDIDCDGPAAWIVREGAVENEVTTLFSAKSEVDTKDLYQPFESPTEVLEHVRKFVAHYKDYVAL